MGSKKEAQNGPKLGKNYKLQQKKSSETKIFSPYEYAPKKYLRPSPHPKLGPVVPEKGPKMIQKLKVVYFFE